MAREYDKVCHGQQEWSRDDEGDGFGEVHCNTTEGLWTDGRVFLRQYSHQDAGVAVRKIVPRLRHQAIESVNGLFKNVFEWGGQVPVQGLCRTRLIVLGALFVYQLVLLYQFEHDKPLGRAIKPFLRAT